MRVQMTEVYRDWINALRDRAGRARIQMRIDRLAHGNPGQHRSLTDGVSELKIDVGPRYRVYFTERGGELIVLLAGGDKSTQIDPAAGYQDSHCTRAKPVGVRKCPRPQRS